MLDLSEESKEDNIKDCVTYFKRMAKMNRTLAVSADLAGLTTGRMARDGDRYHRW
jgi:fructose-bisphosphate aldolase class II